MTTRAFVNKLRIRAEAEWADANPNITGMPGGSTHWRVRLYSAITRRTMTVLFSQGPAISKEPEAVDVLDCLMNDALGYDKARGFEDWCEEYGYDVDSRSAERTYKAVERERKQLARFLGDHYNEIREVEV